jgi:hypothetical protein
VFHRLARPLRLHRAREHVQVGDVHEHRHLGAVLRVDEGPNVADSKGSEEFWLSCSFRGSIPPWQLRPVTSECKQCESDQRLG